MTQVLDEIERQKRLQQAHTWDHNEKVMAKRVMERVILEAARREKVPDAFVEVQAEPNPLDEVLWKDFVSFAEREGVRHLPAKSQTVAAYLLQGGLTHDRMLEVLAVIARRHDKHGLSNPCATAGVRSVLELSIEEKPPRSWKKDEQEVWAVLPADIRFTLSRRQRDYDREVGNARKRQPHSGKN
jgi:hypothetical protein